MTVFFIVADFVERVVGVLLGGVMYVVRVY